MQVGDLERGAVYTAEDFCSADTAGNARESLVE